MLDTNLQHIESEVEFKKVLSTNRNVMVCCGRMGPMCLPVYDVMEKLEPRYPHVAFRDLEFDSPTSVVIRRLPEVRGFNGLPYTVYFRDGQVVAATTSIQTKKQVTEILDREFGAQSVAASGT